MKTKIRLTESNLIKLIKKIIKESMSNDLTIDDFKKIDSYKLVDLGDRIEYQLIDDDLMTIFVIKFFKTPKNEKFKVEFIAPNSEKNKMGVDVINEIDSEIVKSIPSLNENSQLYDNGDEYVIDYLVGLDEFEKLKVLIFNLLERYKF